QGGRNTKGFVWLVPHDSRWRGWCDRVDTESMTDAPAMSGAPSDDADFIDTLTRSGWFRSRQVDTSGAEAVWREHGHEPHRAALGFVANVAGISFRYPRGRLDPGEHTCVLNAADATSAIYDSVVRDYEVRVAEPLCPVGFAASKNLILMMAPSGRV